jgi:hypothetical protein
VTETTDTRRLTGTELAAWIPFSGMLRWRLAMTDDQADEDDLTEQLLLSTRRSLPQRGGRA